MIAIKKINNNVAICLDSKKNELIAFGKGIGFPKMPYEITDLKLVERTFYDISNQYIGLINEIPEEVITFTSDVLDRYTARLEYELNPNVVFTLSDHIAFAILRFQKGVVVRMPLSYDLEQTYPAEVQISREILKEINQKFQVHLANDEVVGIAMHFINNCYNSMIDEGSEPGKEADFEEVLKCVTDIVEGEMEINVGKATFSYARFATHLQFLVDRLRSTQTIATDNKSMYEAVRQQYRAVSSCVDKISAYLQEVTGCEIADEEKLYLILHVNRICEKEGL